MSTMYIACDNCLERGYFLGDVLTLIKAAWLFVQNEPHDHYILSLHTSDPLNFLWNRFVCENRVTLVRDTWEKKNRDAQYEVFDQRRKARVVQGQPFDTYKELYPRLDGGPRQGVLCGREKGLGRTNIFEYYYYGQECCVDTPVNTREFDSTLIYVPQVIRRSDKSVFIAPHEKCQGNKYFTLEFWEQVSAALLEAGYAVVVNDPGGFAIRLGDRILRSFFSFEALVEQLAGERLILCGNTGIGWMAAAVGAPFIALEKDMVFPEYGFRRCGCQSLYGISSSFDPKDLFMVLQGFL